MDPVAKIKLIESLYKVLESAGILILDKDKVSVVSFAYVHMPMLKQIVEEMIVNDISVFISLYSEVTHWAKYAKHAQESINWM